LRHGPECETAVTIAHRAGRDGGLDLSRHQRSISLVGARQYTNREWKLLSWWLATMHPQAEISMNVRVGPPKPLTGLTLPPPMLERMARVRNRWVDAIFIEDGLVNLVEAKIQPDPGIFSRLIHYLRKFRADPEFAQYKNAPVRLIALVYNDDPSVAVEAPWYGVNWTVYQPDLSGFLPPQLLGTPLAVLDYPLPMDWPARLQGLLNPGSFTSS
jgi:hypothetical protein